MELVQLLLLMYGLVFVVSTNGQVTEKKLIDHLFADYSPNARPLKNVSQPVIVHTSYTLVALNNLDERDQVLLTYGWLNLHWKDEFMTWDPEDWGGISVIVVPMKDMWKPDVVIRNSADQIRGEILDEEGEFRAIVASDGTVNLWTAGNIHSSCVVDMTYFPFDDQACEIQLDSWTENKFRVRILNASAELDLNFYRASGQWNILATKSAAGISHYGDTEDADFNIVKFTVYIRRKPLYYVYNIMLPSVLLSLLVLLIFVLPADAGEKISLGITVLLAFSVFQLIIADSMPETSDYLPIVGIYIICTMVVTSVSLLTSVLILRVHHHSPDNPVPACLVALARLLAKLVCTETYLTPTKPTSIWQTKYIPNLREDNTQDPSWSKKNGTDNSSGQSAPAVLRCDLPHVTQCLHDDLHFLRVAREQDDESDTTKQQWVEVARIADRFLLVFFLLVILVAVVVLFGIYPTTKPDMPSVIGMNFMDTISE